jgi:hypothetical protein
VLHVDKPSLQVLPPSLRFYNLLVRYILRAPRNKTGVKTNSFAANDAVCQPCYQNCRNIRGTVQRSATKRGKNYSCVLSRTLHKPKFNFLSLVSLYAVLREADN